MQTLQWSFIHPLFISGPHFCFSGKLEVGFALFFSPWRIRN
jgi:hypothetical protein